ncbi:MAG: hypothetical protein KGL74_11350 [Elusimicrobia bacterium]|nr:hypothetical protein [Elusimicrobiota bacterium]MDE2511707.1 hypothetical protein [Elusimicrobiota bacterium]
MSARPWPLKSASPTQMSCPLRIAQVDPTTAMLGWQKMILSLTRRAKQEERAYRHRAGVEFREPLRGELDSQFLEPEALDVRPPAGADEHLLDEEASRPRAHAEPGGFHMDDGVVAQPQREFLAEDFDGAPVDRGIVQAADKRGMPDGAKPDDGQRRGERLQFEYLVAGQPPRALP